MKSIKYTAQIQLQYLKRKLRISDAELSAEMTKYYNQPQWEVTVTKYGKVTLVTLKDGEARPPITVAKPRFKPSRNGSKPQSANTKRGPSVIVKKRRFIPR